MYFTALFPNLIAMNSGNLILGMMKNRRMPNILKKTWQSASLKAVWEWATLKEKAAIMEVAVVPRLLPSDIE